MHLSRAHEHARNVQYKTTNCRSFSLPQNSTKLLKSLLATWKLMKVLWSINIETNYKVNKTTATRTICKKQYFVTVYKIPSSQLYVKCTQNLYKCFAQNLHTSNSAYKKTVKKSNIHFCMMTNLIFDNF